MKTIEGYGIDSRDYLARAQALLKKNDIPSLFYAAFELRCGIESRLKQYISVREDISERKKQGWQIAKLGKALEVAFESGTKVVVFCTGNDTLFYTPVSSKLQKNGEMLGDLLHVAKKEWAWDLAWFHSKKNFLNETALELEKANKGRLLGPPLIRRVGTEVSMHVYFEISQSDIESAQNKERLETIMRHPEDFEILYMEEDFDYNMVKNWLN